MMKKGRYSVVSIGEVLWDLLPGGAKLGGATANVTYHVGQLGAEGRLVSRVGMDDLGRRALRQLAECGIDPSLVSVDSHYPTGSVSVEISASGQPRYLIHEDVAWDYLDVDEGSLGAVVNADAVYFGTLAQRAATSRSSIQSLIENSKPGALRVYDVNLREGFYSSEVIEASLLLANCLKLSDEELPVIASLFSLEGSVQEQIEELARRFSLATIALTCGVRGSMIYHEGVWSSHSGFSVNLVDTVGAGDSFTAVLMMGLLQGWTMDEIHKKGNRLASFVCTQAGAMPRYPSDLFQFLRS